MSVKITKQNFAKELILPYLLSIMLIEASLYLFTLKAINVYIFIAAAVSAVTFAICSFILHNKIAGTILYIGELFLAFSIGLSNIQQLSKGTYTSTTMPMIIITALTFFISSVVFYFSKILHRKVFLFITSLIPCALYVTSEVDMSIFFTITIIVLIVAICIFNKRKEMSEDATFVNSKASMTGYFDFIVAAAILCIIIPKPYSTLNKDFLANLNLKNGLFNRSGTNYSSAGDYTFSNGSAYYSDLADMQTLIFTVKSESPLYLKRQVFDEYVPERNGWLSLEKYDKGYDLEKVSKGFSNLYERSTFYDVLSESQNVFPAGSDYSVNIPYIEMQEQDNSYIVITAHDFSTRYVLTTGTPVEIYYGGGLNFQNFYVNNSNLFPEIRMLPPNITYSVEYIPYQNSATSDWLNNDAADITADDYTDFCINLYLNSSKEFFDKNKDIITSIYNENNLAQEYEQNCYAPTSDEIQSLAEQLTKDCTYDYEKAAVLEQWLSMTGGFKYDTKYLPPDDKNTAEYFIFTSKKGTCSDYATAFTLMARSLGIPTRYVEGYTMEPSEDEEGIYNVYLKNSHAYCECFIPNCGWVVYDPTPEHFEEDNTDDTGITVNYTMTFVFSLILTVLLVLILVAAIFHRQIGERIFRIRIKFADNTKAIYMIYSRIISRTNTQYKIKAENYTPDQLAEYAAEKALADIKPCVIPFVNVCYGMIKPDSNDKKSAYECYKTYYKSTKKRRGKLK